MNADPKIIFLAGVSGAGKTTMLQLLLEDSRFEKVCSVTTREPREGEISGDQYIFMDRSEFESLIEKNKFLEYAYVHQRAYYGTRLDFIQSALALGKYPVKNIDMLGMEIIEKEWKIDGTYLSFFLDIPEDVMKTRILQRQPDMSEEELSNRLESASMERMIATRLEQCIMIDASKSIEQVFAMLMSHIVVW